MCVHCTVSMCTVSMCVLYCVYTLTCVAEKRLLESVLDGLSFSCGSPLQEADLDLPEQLQSVVSVRELQCGDPVEALYYSADYTDICVHCSSDIEVNETLPEFFPQCTECAGKPTISRKKSKK